ncbi:MAG: MarR family winged helix-turn-helix transcriptional regulator [Bacteroidia bacterium]|nr:MarR family winged helix-turn-helix transcriptional regulator [Bacteroidia bacterium]
MNNLQFYSDQTIEGKIIASLERISQAFRVLLWQKSKEFSLTPLQTQILIFLLTQSEEKKKVSYLAKEFNVTKATISDTIKTLEQKSLIIKKNEILDSRSYIINLTKKGIEIAEQTSDFAKQIYIPVIKLSQNDKHNLLLSLIKVIEHLNKTGVISVLRMCTTCSYHQPSEDKNIVFCTLLNQELHYTDLRIDCQEHKMLDFLTIA